jgi:hypothetical protein
MLEIASECLDGHHDSSNFERKTSVSMSDFSFLIACRAAIAGYRVRWLQSTMMGRLERVSSHFTGFSHHQGLLLTITFILLARLSRENACLV